MQVDCEHCIEDYHICFWGVEPHLSCLRCVELKLKCSLRGKFEPLPSKWWTQALLPAEKGLNQGPNARLKAWNNLPRPVKNERWLEDDPGYDTEYGPNNKPSKKVARYSSSWYMHRSASDSDSDDPDDESSEDDDSPENTVSNQRQSGSGGVRHGSTQENTSRNILLSYMTHGTSF